MPSDGQIPRLSPYRFRRVNLQLLPAYALLALWVGYFIRGSVCVPVVTSGDTLLRLLAAGDLHWSLNAKEPHRQQALSAYREAIRLYPGDPRPRIRLATALLKTMPMEPEGRREILLEIIRHTRSTVYAGQGGIFLLAHACAAMSELASGREESLRWLDLAEAYANLYLDSDLNTGDARSAGMLGVMGRARLRRFVLTGEKAHAREAVRQLSLCVGLRPRSLSPRFALAMAWRAVGDIPVSRKAAASLLSVRQPLGAETETKRLRGLAASLLSQRE